MTRVRVAAAVFFLFGCAAQHVHGGPASTLAPDPARPIVGDWAAPSWHGVYMRFTSDGRTALALVPEGLPHAGTTGTWKLSGDRLTVTNLTGSCADPESDRVGEYDVTITSDTIRFLKIEDHCARRAAMDRETWTRVTPAT